VLNRQLAEHSPFVSDPTAIALRRCLQPSPTKLTHPVGVNPVDTFGRAE
jgi:hypothetical protein